MTDLAASGLSGTRSATRAPLPVGRPALRTVAPTVAPTVPPATLGAAAPVQRPPAPHPAPRTRRNRTAVLLALAAVIYVADLVTKVVMVALLPSEETVQVPGTVLTLRLIRNPGAAFGLGVGVTALFTVISVVVVAVILRTARRLGSIRWAVALGLLLGGALGNLTDRIFRSPGPLRGHVVDFVEIPGWPIFNCADASIVAAGLMIVALALRNVPIEGRSRLRTSSAAGALQSS